MTFNNIGYELYHPCLKSEFDYSIMLDFSYALLSLTLDFKYLMFQSDYKDVNSG